MFLTQKLWTSNVVQSRVSTITAIHLCEDLSAFVQKVIVFENISEIKILDQKGARSYRNKTTFIAKGSMAQ